MTYVKILSALSLLLATGSVVNAQTIVNISFDNDTYAKHFEATVDGVALGKSSDQQSCLVIDGKVDAQPLKPIKVQPLQKYKLTMRAAIDAADTVEINDRLADFSAVTRGNHFPACELHFSDNDGQNVFFALHANHLVEGTQKVKVESVDVITQQFHDYVFVFYAPPTAETLHLNLAPRKRTLLVESMVLKVEDAEGTVNCNPDFRYGELNLSGWRPDTEGRLFRRPDNTTVLKCGTAATSSVFIVDDELRYSFLCKGVGYNKKSGKVIILFFDENEKVLGHTHLFWDKDMQDGATKAGIKPISGSKMAILKASSVILEKVLVTKD
ncbi:hypothetical protein Pla52o_24070 [Novipirellula galeiformis]|uniref:Uncharacterized protein n=1 Tax=Novipirellula galeiformis TaxID=2528004 RepID=A0A5C6CFR0_9BACT|nr:hypothetical protein [Novipirellula galeiformis]TWU22875.1 hypothetical protein Pla52o_24070 [Novipirellula galeiformis]